MTKLSMLKTFAPALALAVVALPGCGGGGGDQTSAPAAESAPAHHHINSSGRPASASSAFPQP